MRHVGRSLVVAVVLVLVAVSAGGEILQPLIVGWERFFKLEWELGTRRGRPVVAGYILNDWGMPAARVQLLVDAVGADGEIIAQRVEWLGGGMLTPGMRAYFEVPPPAPAPAYRVQVFAFDWVQSGDRLRRW